nr:unnamed protein product [Trichobilharzia regenti]
MINRFGASFRVITDKKVNSLVNQFSNHLTTPGYSPVKVPNKERTLITEKFDSNQDYKVDGAFINHTNKFCDKLDEKESIQSLTSRCDYLQPNSSRLQSKGSFKDSCSLFGSTSWSQESSILTHEFLPTTNQDNFTSNSNDNLHHEKILRNDNDDDDDNDGGSCRGGVGVVGEGLFGFKGSNPTSWLEDSRTSELLKNSLDLREAGLLDIREGEKLEVMCIYMEPRLLVRNTIGEYGLVRQSEVRNI